MRVTAASKRRQMVLLHESVHFIKMGLNERFGNVIFAFICFIFSTRFLALRDLKRRIIENVKKDNDRLLVINRELGIRFASGALVWFSVEPQSNRFSEKLYQPEFDPLEWPEHRDIVTDEV